jgi:hypothetical protein
VSFPFHIPRKRALSTLFLSEERASGAFLYSDFQKVIFFSELWVWDNRPNMLLPLLPTMVKERRTIKEFERAAELDE